jgi:S-adenosyl-L-methionine hydrolase (adenosine-forming)
MPIVTFTTDWNANDYYSASVKGHILNRCPGTSLIDITNQVPTFNIALAAFQLRHSYPHFPAGSIHIITVNCETRVKQPYVAIKANGQYFIGYDNGIFGLIFDRDPDEVVKIENAEAMTFPELTVFAPAACEIIQSGKISELGQKYTLQNNQVPMLPTIEKSVINGSVIYIDSYRNVLTNITRDLFDQIGEGRPFDIFVQSNHNRINRLNKLYSDSSLGEMLALFNGLGLLEIAINGGNAADLLHLALNSSVRIKFKED